MSESYMVVVGVEFGNRYTSYAFATRDTPHRSSVDNDWGLYPPSTSILLDPTGQLQAFGQDALSRYEELGSEKNDWYLFKHFTQKQNLKVDGDGVTVTDVAGKTMDATKVWSLAIHFVVERYQNIFNVLMERVEVFLRERLFVFITPTSWSNEERNCMFHAAQNAGIDKSAIRIILDSEAASMICQYLLSENPHTYSLRDTACLAVNWDNDRVEISLMEAKFDGSLRITHIKNKTLSHSDPIENGFLTWIAGLCDITVSKTIGYLDGDWDWLQSIKLNIRDKSSMEIKPVTVSLPAALSRKLTKGQLAENNIRVVGGKIRFDDTVLQVWMEGPITDGVDTIKSLLPRQELRNVKNIILFGEFSASRMVVEAIKGLGLHIIRPNDVGVALLRGACILGHFPQMISERIVRSTDNSYTKEIIRRPLVVAAFDFGTTYSGYAYSMKDNPLDIWTNKGWNSGKHISLKAPTSVLLDKGGKFHSFGYSAEKKYGDLAEDDDHNGWMLFRRFKMLLHNVETISRDMEVEDTTGKHRKPAIDIFAFAIDYLRKELIKTVNDKMTGITEEDIMYVVTVPAIWNDAAKQFMKEAAFKAGIKEDKLKLALEPEAASIWCQHIQTDARERLSKPGTQFMVVDLGGGTADISVQEKQDGENLKEIHRASGGPWGGTKVDENFFKWMTDIFGQEALHRFMTKNMSEFFELESEFEIKKRTIEPGEEKGFIILRVSAELRRISEEINGTKVDAVIKRMGLTDDVIYSRDKLKIRTRTVMSWFKKPIDYTVRHVSSILSEPRMQKVENVMLVGGFAECQLMQEAFKIDSLISKKKIVIPEEAGIAVLKGAVEFGQRPTVIMARVMKYSYGIQKDVNFDPNFHDKKYIQYEKSMPIVPVFEVFIQADSDIGIDEVIRKGFVPTSMESTTIKVYSSSNPSPRYVTEEGCKKIGELHIAHTEGTTLQEKIFTVQFEFGDTDILVKTIKQTGDGEQIDTFSIDCL